MAPVVVAVTQVTVDIGLVHLWLVILHHQPGTAQQLVGG